MKKERKTERERERERKKKEEEEEEKKKRKKKKKKRKKRTKKEIKKKKKIHPRIFISRGPPERTLYTGCGAFQCNRSMHLLQSTDWAKSA